MLAFFYKNFSKRKKSTKVPDNDVEYDSKEIYLKDNTSEDSPTFILKESFENNYTYVLWNRHYYFIDNVISINSTTIEVVCSKDLLATFKPYIGQMNAFIERSESAFDKTIYDNAISQTTDIYTATETTDSFTNLIDVFDGMYVLGTVSSSGVEHYAMSKSRLRNLMASIFNPINPTYGGVLDPSALTTFNPFQYIISLQWFPLPLSSVNPTVNPEENVKFGWFSSGITANKLNDKAFYSNILTVSMPTPIYDDFRQYSNNWTQYKINIPSIGIIDLDSASVKNGLRYRFSFDYIGGSFTFVLLDANRVISTYECKGAVDVQIGHYDTSNLISQSAGIISSIARLDLGGAYEGIHNLANPTPSVVGSAGSISKWVINYFLTVSYKTFGTKDDPVFIYGRPTMAYKQIGTLTGYVKTLNAQVDIPSHGDEKDRLNALLDSGFYYE